MDADITGVVARNRAQFDALAVRAESAAHAGRLDRAAAFVQSAARYAWYNHPGRFRSARLEDLLRRLAEEVPEKGPRPRIQGHVLHVATQVYAAGGHTRLIERWIANDTGRVHSLLLTAQGGLGVPEGLTRAVRESGGLVLHAGRARGRLLARAAHLRRAAFSAPAAILLHTHPHDALPSLALQGVPAPVALINHADHVFGLGADVASVFVDIRPAGQRLSLRARGIPENRSALVPIPLAEPGESSRARARAKWSIGEEAVVVVSIASAYKFGADEGDHFVDVHREYLRRCPDVVMLVVGPSAEGRWSETAEGRIRAVGMVDDPASAYAAADIYADSLPFASLTSLLDAAARGIPVVAMAGAHAGTALSSDDLALTGGVHFADREAYIEELTRLTTDADYRRARGAALRSSVRDAHVPPGWTRRLDAFYEQLEQRRAQPAPSTPVVRDEIRDADADAALARFQIAAGLSADVWRSEVEDAPLLDASARWALMRRIPPGERRRALTYAIPEPMRSVVSAVAHRMARSRH